MASPEAVEWVSCCCSRCDTKLFEVQNIWIRVTPTYVTLSSVVGGLYLRDIAAVVTNELEWDGANELLGCKLRKLTCGSCGKSIGVECVRASTQSQQYQGCGILKSSRIQLRALSSASPIDINIETENQDTEPLVSMSEPRPSNKKSLDTTIDFKCGRSNDGSSHTPSQVISRRSLINAGDGNFNTVIARLNVITSQLTANESRFEAHRIQLDEQQIQLDTLQEQSGQIVGLLENLTQKISNFIDIFPTIQQSKHNHTMYEPISQPNHIQENGTALRIPKAKRSRGRPRTRCVFCKKGAVIENSELCGNCLTGGPNMRCRKKLSSVPFARTDQTRRTSISASSVGSVPNYQPGFRIPRTLIDESELETVQILSKPYNLTSPRVIPHVGSATSDIRETKSQKFSSSRLGHSMQRSPSGTSQSKGLKQGYTEGDSIGGGKSTELAQRLINRPFTEDSIPDATVYSDIMDTENTEVTTSESGSYTTETSVAESIPIEGVPEFDIEMQEADDGLEEGEILSQAHRPSVANHTSSRPTSTSAKVEHTSRSTNSLPPSHVPVAIMGTTKSNKQIPQNLVGRPRKPKPSSKPDGDESHDRLVERVMGPSWYGVKRMF